MKSVLKIGSLCLFCIAGSMVLWAEPPYRVTSPPKSVVKTFRLSSFYKKGLMVGGFPVLGSDKVSDFAVAEAGYIVDKMLAGREDVRQALIKNRIRLAIMAYDERTTQIPEHSDLTPAKYWDRRARGLGATKERPAVSAAEENLLEFWGDPYKGENILVHEFAHAIHLMGLNTLDAGFQAKLEQTYQSALKKELWKGTYAATNAEEYWAEGVQSYFDCNQQPNHDNNGVDTREKLEKYDPDLYALIATEFRRNAWRYIHPSLRTDKAHLQGYQPDKSPRFQWGPELNTWYKNYKKTHKE